ncbi:MAG: hypothetical protein BWY81_00779 [Firmicutes bacterium ADurb.Bin467]|nr:MAG: hypothetical protein BWY81_00779 [Firmicutes bacterium ADurb.Bin467]
MRDARVRHELVLREHADDLDRRRARLRDRLRDVLGPLARAGQEHARGRALDRAELRVRLGEEVVRVHRRGQHRRERARAGLRLDRGREHDHVGGNQKLLVVQQIAPLYHQLAVLPPDLADHALDVLDAVLLGGAAVELVEVLAGRAHVDVEHAHADVRVLLAHEHRVLRGVHAADLRAVGLALARVLGAARADALYEHDLVRVFAVRRAHELPLRGPGGVQDALELERCHDVGALLIRVLAEFLQRDWPESRRGDDRAVPALDHFIPLVVVDRAGGAYLLADAALAGPELDALARVDRRDVRDRLRERDVDRAAVVEPHVELVLALSRRALRDALGAAGAPVRVNIARLFANRHREISDEARDLLDLAVGEQLDVRALRGLDHLRRQYARGAVERRERLVELRHAAADRRRFLDDIDLVARLGDIERRLYARDAAADHERALRDRALPGRERRVFQHLRDRRARERDRLGGTDRLVLVNPRALLADVRDLDHVRVEPGALGGPAERLLVHARRAGADDDAGQRVLADGGDQPLLADF